MAGGYMGKILWVDLTKGEFKEEKLDEQVYKDYLGGYGLGVKILFDRMKPGIDPLGPENILGMLPGLLTGTGAVFVGRYMVVGKSPLTGGWADANSGGYFSPEIKKCGYDGIFFTGKSPKPVYLLIKDGKIELRDASHLWGKDTIETEIAIKKELNDEKVQVACIGPAGERLSLISGIVTDRGRIAARSGVGAIMGSKNLKAVVLKGNQLIPVADRKRVTEESRNFLKRIEGSSFIQRLIEKRMGKIGTLLRKAPFHSRQEGFLWRNVLKKYGTCGILAFCVEGGDAPVKNWKGIGYIDFPLSESMKISDDNIIKYEIKKYNCYSCPIACGGIVQVKIGDYVLEESHKPEYETLAAMGSMTLVSDPAVLFEANNMCNRAGMDTISAGSTIAFAMECYEKGIITKEDTGGIELKWGNGEALLKFLEKMIKREGIGDIFADGVRVASRKLGKGSEEFAIHAGGQEIPMHDPRYDPGYGIGYYCEPTPGRHTIVSYTYAELMEVYKKFKKFKKFSAITSKAKWYSEEEKGKAMAICSKYVQVANGCGFCIFGLQIGGNIPIFEWVNASTGWNLKEEDFLKIGERIETLRHCFNLREGLNPPKDFLPAKRALGYPPLPKGPTAGVSVNIEKLGREFYEEYGWDFDTGLPKKETLERLGLSYVMDFIYKK
jgi:aldehyde:ferredoxin oxidoreductase